MISITLSQLPLLNQRNEYMHYKKCLSDPEFRKEIDSSEIDDFDCGKFMWSGFQEGVSVFLQRVVLGVEAWIPTAVIIEMSCQGRLTADMLDQINDPFRLGGRGTADTYFNRLPGQISEENALKEVDPELWESMRTFYRGIRNPLFHGSYVSKICADDLDYVFDHFDRLYSWCDSWCDVPKRLDEIGSGQHGILDVR